MSNFYDITQDPNFQETIDFIKSAEKDLSLLSEDQKKRLPAYNEGMGINVKKMLAINRQAKRKHSSNKKFKVSKKQQRNLYKIVWFKRMWMKYLVDGDQKPTEYNYTKFLQQVSKKVNS